MHALQSFCYYWMLSRCRADGVGDVRVRRLCVGALSHTARPQIPHKLLAQFRRLLLLAQVDDRH